MEASADVGQGTPASEIVSDVAAPEAEKGLVPTKEFQAENASQSAKAAEAEAKRLFKLMVDGQELEVDEDELKRGYSHKSAAEARMREAANLRKEVMDLFKEAKGNPDKIFELLDLDPYAYSESKLASFLEEQSLTPEQRKARDNERKVAEYEAKENARKEAERKSALEKAEAEAVALIDNEVASVLKESGIKNPSPRHVARIAEYLLASLESGPERMSAKDAFSKVREDLLQDAREFYAEAEPEALLSLLPKEVIDKIRKADIATLKKKGLPKLEAGAAPTSKREDAPKKTRSMDKFFEDLLPGNRVHY